MHIDAAISGQIQNLLGEDLAEGCDDNHIRMLFPETLHRLRPLHPLRLVYRDIPLLRTLLHRCLQHLPAAAPGPVRLGHHKTYLLSVPEQSLQHRHGKIRRSHKNNLHFHTPCRVVCGTRWRNARMGFLAYSSSAAPSSLSSESSGLTSSPSTFSVKRCPSRCSISWQKQRASSSVPSRVRSFMLRSSAVTFT